MNAVADAPLSPGEDYARTFARLVEREQLCLAGIDAVQLYAEGMPADAMPIDLADAVQHLEGVILYACLLESILLAKGGVQPPETRGAARGMATIWRTRVPPPPSETEGTPTQ